MSVYVPLRGSQKSLMPNSRAAGPINRNELASVTIRVRSLGDPNALVAKAYKLGQTPLSERRYLSHDELEKAYGASSSDLDKIEHFVSSHNLRVTRRSSLERSVVLNGKLGDLLAAFRADVQMYHHSTGTYRGRKGKIFIPQSLETLITAIIGFDTRPKFRSPHCHKQLAFNGPGGQNGVSAIDFATRYNFPTEYNGTSLDGTGETVAIIELGGGYQASDLQVFFQYIGVPVPNISAVSVDGATNNPGPDQNSDGEVMLDVEVVGAVVPNANIAIYFAPNKGDQGFIDAISAAVHDTQRKPCVISISWGGPEDQMSSATIAAFHELFAAAANLGITICVASGDHGTADLAASEWDQKIHVNHPTSDDLVLGCGGTQIDQTSGTDVVWNDNTPFNISDNEGGGGWASGGGISTVFQVPSYQANENIPVSIDTGAVGRGVPDIAMSATNYFTRVDAVEGPSGGTSAVAPLMAALIARLSQAKQKNVGFINPILYQGASSGWVHDVTVGNNAIANTVRGYSAGPGWDACTGLGTPDGSAILNGLQ